MSEIERKAIAVHALGAFIRRIASSGYGSDKDGGEDDSESFHDCETFKKRLGWVIQMREKNKKSLCWTDVFVLRRRIILFSSSGSSIRRLAQMSFLSMSWGCAYVRVRIAPGSNHSKAASTLASLYAICLRRVALMSRIHGDIIFKGIYTPFCDIVHNSQKRVYVQEVSPMA